MKQETPDELESWLKERTDQYLLYPSDRVWKNIHKGLHPNRKWIHLSLMMLVFVSASTFVILEKENKASIANYPAVKQAYQYSHSDPFNSKLANPYNSTLLEQEYSKFSSKLNGSSAPAPVLAMLSSSARKQDEPVAFEIPQLLSPSSRDFATALQKPTAEPADPLLEEKKTMLGSAIESVVEKAKQIRKKAGFQFYLTPTVGYRSLSGKATNSSFQYSQIFLSNNALFARDVKDAVNHSPGMGMEVGAAMLYPLTKRLTFRAGLQANYTQYKIRAFSSMPEVANYGMNNYSYGSIPISAVSVYRNTSGYTNTTLRNEHYMIAVPVGFDYVVAGNNKINFAVGSTIQPTYVFAQYSYLISTNLKNYAKEPSLNRRWNINSAVEASINITKGDVRWSISPQYRYQLISSFKEKYPIKENLMDFGIRLGVVKTIH